MVFADINVKTLAQNSTNMIYAGTNSGVFRTVDNCDGWIPKNDGLYSLYVNSLIFNSNDIAFVGTSNSGVFQSLNSTTTAEIEKNLSFTFNLFQNYQTHLIQVQRLVGNRQ